MNNAPQYNAYFISGCNHAGEIRGVARAGLNVGVAVGNLDRAGNSERELIGLAGSGTLVFVDSGAFGEVRFDAEIGRLVVKKEISEKEWLSRLGVYERLAVKLHSQLFVVAPDCVGDQARTLQRLEKYRDIIRRIWALGCNVIVPVQKGSLPMSEFWCKELEILGLQADRLIAGIPSKKDATTVLDISTFLRDSAPPRIHFLGLGPRSRKWANVMAAVSAGSASVGRPEVFCDSVRITALVGRVRSGVRPLTAARDALIAEGWKTDDVAALKCAALLRVHEAGWLI